MDSDGKNGIRILTLATSFFFSLSFVFLYTFVSLDWSLVNFTPTCVCVCVQDPNSCYPTVRCLLLLLLVLLFFFLNTLCWFSCRFVFFLYFFRSVGTRLQGWTFTRPTRLEIIIYYYWLTHSLLLPHCSLYIQQLRHSWICFKSTIVFWNSVQNVLKTQYRNRYKQKT
jgi:hypothetical protein